MAMSQNWGHRRGHEAQFFTNSARSQSPWLATYDTSEQAKLLLPYITLAHIDIRIWCGHQYYSFCFNDMVLWGCFSIVYDVIRSNDCCIPCTGTWCLYALFVGYPTTKCRVTCVKSSQSQNYFIEPYTINMQISFFFFNKVQHLTITISQDHKARLSQANKPKSASI